jgi:hypothetical protein
MAKLSENLQDAIDRLSDDEDAYLEISPLGARISWRTHQGIWPINTNTAKALVNRKLVKAVGNTKNYYGEYILAERQGV